MVEMRKRRGCNEDESRDYGDGIERLVWCEGKRSEGIYERVV